eukprot:jgi/Orpsp1_1/1180053/evm.model.c7180000071974.1
MFINNNAYDNIYESIIKRDGELDVTSVINNVTTDDNTTSVIATRVSTIVVILSWYIYGKYAFFCLRGLIRHKNFNFLFPLAATLFAFANNTNDIANYIYHQSDCYPFWLIFVASATLNWAPISWLQAYRLALIAKIYLPKFTAFIIISLAVIFSSIYCTYYFLNLSLFDYTKTDAIGCAVTNPELNTRNEKLNDLVGQGIVELFIIAIAKIIIYPLIHYTSSIPGLDVFWDILSIIVIISAYNLVNFPYEHSDNSNKSRHNLRKNIFNFIDTNIGNNSGNGSSSNSIHNSKSIKTPDLKAYDPYIKRESCNNTNTIRETYSQNYSYNSNTKKEKYNQNYSYTKINNENYNNYNNSNYINYNNANYNNFNK